MPGSTGKLKQTDFPGRNGLACARIPLAARVFIDGQWRSCRVVSISTGEARLIVAELASQPGELMLELGACGRYPGRAVWANGREIGVKFHCHPAEIAETLMALAMYG